MKKILFFAFTFYFLLMAAVAEEGLPTISTIGNKEIEVGETLRFVVTAQDPSGRAVFYEASNLPYGAKLNPKTGEFEWTPTIFQVGEHRITFQAWDRMDPKRMALETINIRVYYRKTYHEKGWGLGLGKEEVLETSVIEDLYPQVKAIKVEGKEVSLEEEKVLVSQSPKIEVVLESIYRIDPKLVTILLDGRARERIRFTKIKTFGERKDVVELTLEVAFKDLTPKEHELVVMGGNELGVVTHRLMLEVRRKAL